MALLELADVSKSYTRGSFWGRKEWYAVFANVHLIVEAGASVGLLGRSGTGKSTLGRIALGLEEPDQGEARFRGRALHTLKGLDYLEFRRNVQVVFQNALGSVNPQYTAGRIIAEPIRNFENLSIGQMKRRVAELLEQVGLKASDADKYPTQFSGGELQRVSIARAIAVHPALIVLDEAVSSLDMVTQAHILELLGRLRSELGTAYLFISHDIRILLQATDHLVLLHDGRLTPLNQNMEPEDSSVRPFFQNLIAAVPSPLPPVLADGGTWSPEELIPRTFPVSDQNGP